MNILHLSDLHFGSEQDANQWYSQLAYDITKELDCLSLDLVIVSGDITHHADKKEYRAALTFFEKILNKFALKSDQIIFVPGNHDVDWTISKSSYSPMRRKEYAGNITEQDVISNGDYVEKKDHEIYKRRFENFSEFHRFLKGTPYPLDYEKQGIVYDFPDNNLLVLGLNSAWNLDHYYHNRASINSAALTGALDVFLENSAYNKRLKIAVWHHPLHSKEQDCIKETDFLQRLVVADFELILHGHIHLSTSEIYRYDKVEGGRNIEIISAGTFGAPTSEWVPGYPLQYNFIQLKDSGIIVKTRSRKEPNGAWTPEAIWLQGPGKDPSSQYEIKLKPRTDNVNTVAFENTISPSISEKIHTLRDEETMRKKISHLPPKLPVSLVDRTDEKQDIINSLRGNAPLVTIIGPGGLGKTALAIDILYRCVADDIFDEVVYVTAKAFEYVVVPGNTFIDRKSIKITRFDDVLDEIGRQSGFPVSDLPRQPKLERVLEILSAKRCLVVIDNYESLDDKVVAEKFFRHQIPSKSKFLITSRHHISTGNVIALKGMDDKYGSEFIKSYAKSFKVNNPLLDNEKILRDLSKWSGGTPLVMKYILGQINDEFNKDQLDILLSKDLEDEELLWFCFEGVYNHLSLSEKYVVQALALLPSSMSRDTLVKVTGLVSGFIAEALENLYKKSLVDYLYLDEETRYSILPITRAYVKRKHFSETLTFWNRAINHYSNIISDNEKNYVFLEREFENILFILDWCIEEGLHQNTVTIFKAISQYLDMRGMNNERFRYAEIAVASAYKIGRDNDGDWIKVFDIAWIYQRRGKEHRADAERIHYSLIDKLKDNQDTDSLKTLGLCYRDMALLKGNYIKEKRLEKKLSYEHLKDERQEVLDMAYRSLEYFEKAKYDDGIQIALGLIGGVLRGNKKYDDAIAHFNRALELAKKNKDAKVAEWLSLIGRVYIATEEYEKAIQYIDEAMEQYINAKWMSGIAYALHYKGTISYKIGDLEQAREYFVEAADIELESGLKRHYEQLLRDIEIVDENLRGIYDRRISMG